jgi:hypothetical protein
MRNAISPFQIPAPLQTLYDAAAAIGPQFGLSPEAVFGDCGLRLEIPRTQLHRLVHAAQCDDVCDHGLRQCSLQLSGR